MVGYTNTNRSEFLPGSESNEVSYEGNGCFVATKQAMILVVVAVLAVGLVGAALFVYGPNKDRWKNETISDLEKELNNTVNHIRSSSNYLPINIEPIHYRLRIRPILNETMPRNSTFNGKARILMRCVKTTKHIMLHSKNLIIHNVRLLQSEPIAQDSNEQGNDQAMETNRWKIVELEIAKNYLLNSDIYQIDLTADLVPNRNYSLELVFSGRIGSNFQGLYRTSYLSDKKETRWLLTTFFHPTYAREVFPCFDQPTFKASFEISIARKTDMKSLSNMPLKETEPMENVNGWVWDHFQRSPAMAPHSVAMTVLDFESVEVDSSSNMAGPLFKIWTASYLTNYTQYAGARIPKIFNFIQSYFGIKYPLPKIDFLATSGMAEDSQGSWGLVAFRDSAFLLNPEESSVTKEEQLFKLIVRELCHQWLGDLVSLRDWFNIWTIEGFATFMGEFVYNAIESRESSIDPHSIRIAQTTLKSDSIKFQYSLETKLKNPLDLQMIYDATAYNKGSCLFHMLNFMLSDRLFKKGLQDLIRNWQYKAINRTTLWDSFSNATKSDFLSPPNFRIEAMMNSWVKQSGYPVVTFNRDYETGSVMVTQKKFAATNNNTSDQLWYIPLTYFTGIVDSVQQTHTMWLNNEQQIQLDNFTDPHTNNTWMICNVNQIGLYRVNYDLNNWQLLQEQLIANYSAIPTNVRSQLISDAFELASFSYLDYKIAFGLIEYAAKKERNYLPWFSLYNVCESLKTTIGATSHYGIYRKFVIGLLTPIFTELGTEEKPTDSIEEKRLRLLILKFACDVNYAPCVIWARKQFQSWLSSPDANPIPFEFREVVQCTAISMGGYQEWEFVWNQTMFLAKSPADLQLGYLTLGCSQAPWIINSYLEGTLNGNIPLQYVPYVFQSLTSPAAIHYGFTFVRVNWENFYKTFKYSFNVLQSLFENLLLRLSTKVELVDLTFFYNEYKDQLRTVSPLMLNVVEQIKSRIAWRAKYLKTVIDLLLKEEK